MINEKLLVPLSCLPGPVPVGAPLLDVDTDPPRRATLTRYEDHRGERPRLGVTYQDRRPCPEAGHTCAHVEAVHPVHFALDLTPPDPPLARVDGLDVGLLYLGWGGPGAHAEVHPVAGSDVECVLEVGDHNGMALWASWDNPWNGIHGFPALADIDPGSPTALREAVAAVLRAGGAR